MVKTETPQLGEVVGTINQGASGDRNNPVSYTGYNGLEEDDEIDPAILICDPDFEVRLEILDTENPEEDKALGRRFTALINTDFRQNESSCSSASFVSSQTERR
jgi:hypothetical protein